MFAGALVGLGADARKVVGVLKPLARVRFRNVKKRGVPAIKFDVDFKPESREYVKLVESVGKLRIKPKAKRLALRVLKILAEAESAVHGTPLRKVRLHEAVDCVVDAVAAAVALDDLGFIDETFTSSIVSCGTLAPAAKHIIADYGIPVRFISDREIVTPTGAALLAALVSEYRDVEYHEAGVGAGDMSLSWPNVLRVAEAHPKVILESNIDDCTPEHISHMVSSLMDAGALDVHVLPCVMKKGRIGFLVRVLTEDPEAHAGVIMAETKTLGVRVQPVDSRFELDRTTRTVKVRFGRETEEIRVKYSPLGFKPEFDDLARAARKHRITFREAREKTECLIRGKRS
jgi:hypothetical protein